MSKHPSPLDLLTPQDPQEDEEEEQTEEEQWQAFVSGEQPAPAPSTLARLWHFFFS